jgi:hypothetical protein
MALLRQPTPAWRSTVFTPARWKSTAQASIRPTKLRLRCGSGLSPTAFTISLRGRQTLKRLPVRGVGQPIAEQGIYAWCINICYSSWLSARGWMRSDLVGLRACPTVWSKSLHQTHPEPVLQRAFTREKVVYRVLSRLRSWCHPSWPDEASSPYQESVARIATKSSAGLADHPLNPEPERYISL